MRVSFYFFALYRIGSLLGRNRQHRNPQYHEVKSPQSNEDLVEHSWAQLSSSNRTIFAFYMDLLLEFYLFLSVVYGFFKS